MTQVTSVPSSPKEPVDDDAPIAEDDTEAPAALSTAPPAARLTPVRIVTVVVIVLLVAALIVTQVQLSNQRSVTNERATVLSTARVYAADVAGYDYRHLQKDFSRVEAEATPTFKRKFESSSAGLSKVLTQYHAIATAKVLTAGVVSLSSSQAVVILFVNQTVSNTAQKGGPNVDDSRVKVTMVQSGGRWLLDNLQVL